MKILRNVLTATVLLALLIFSLGNSQSVEIVFFNFRSRPLPLFLVLILFFVLGFLLAWIWERLRIAQLRRQNHQLRREADALRRGSSEDRNRSIST